MFLFNKSEVYMGWSLKDFCDVRETLEAADIHYRYKVGDSMGLGGARRMGSFGQNPDYAKSYTIYVRKQDFEQAQHVIAVKRHQK